MGPSEPLMVQSDGTLMLHTVHTAMDSEGHPLRDPAGRPVTAEHPRYQAARNALAPFAELEKSPDYLHTYRVNAVSIWNAAALGITAQHIERTLDEFSCVPVPAGVLSRIRAWMERYGLLRIERVGSEERFRLVSADPAALEDVLGHSSVRARVEVDEQGRVFVDPLERGPLKQALIRIGFPVDDRGGFVDGDPLQVLLRSETLSGSAFALRDYQRLAAEAFHAGGSASGGSGVVVLPCGAGKTVVGMAVMQLVGAKTLILTTNTIAVRQWKQELLDKTELTAEQVGEYTGDRKEVCPVTITTYQMVTWRRSKGSEFGHFSLFSRENWGLVIYDEVHLLPAPVFRVTAGLQARRRLGLTATLVREDGKEDEVFCLIGPKRYDVPWKVLEGQGFIASAQCVEVRVPLGEEERVRYIGADARAKFRIASENPAKTAVVRQILQRHDGDRVLIIGQYIDQVTALARDLGVPLITGKTPQVEREALYSRFRSGDVAVLVVSKVGNFAIDLPDANVAIQISGTFGSRQEEAQRLGRILRPKSDGSGASFYAVVTLASKDQEFAERRQLFLTEQGYSYNIIEAHALDSTAAVNTPFPWKSSSHVSRSSGVVS
jgi:DNA excision repair protein ERCC-3